MKYRITNTDGNFFDVEGYNMMECKEKAVAGCKDMGWNLSKVATKSIKEEVKP